MEKYEFIAAVAAISELLYIANQQKKEITYDVSPLIDIALSTNDKEWFMELTKLS